MEEPSENPDKKKKNPLKRRVSSSESAIRTDLVRLSPNEGKAKVLRKLIEDGGFVANFFITAIHQKFLLGEKVSTELWKTVPSDFPIQGSTLLQPIAASAAANYESHLGLLSRDFSKRVKEGFDRLFSRLEKSPLPPGEKLSKAKEYSSAKHDLLAINLKKAWTARTPEARAKVKKRVGDENVHVNGLSFEKARRIFLSVSRGRNLPDLSLIQGEQTRTSAKLFSLASVPAKSLEEGEESSSFSWWLRLGTPEGPILVPGLFHRGLALRNEGMLSSGAGEKGENGFPVLDVTKRQKPFCKKRPKRHLRESSKSKNRINPSGIRPEKVESIGIVMSFPEGHKGKPEFHAAIRSQMRDCFEAMKSSYAPKVETLGIDFGIDNFLTLTHPLHTLGEPGSQNRGSRFIGSDFLKTRVLPVLSEIQRLRAKMQFDSELARQNAKALGKPVPEPVFDSKRSRLLVRRVEGMLETFLGTAFNRIASEIAPACIVVEELDFRECNLSSDLNSILTNCGRRFLDAKLKDLHEKFGIDIVRVKAAYTSQECSSCGFVAPSNRKGPDFLCKSCGHSDHADLNASESIAGRRTLGHSLSTLVKRRGVLCWKPSGRPGRVPQQDWQSLGKAFDKPLLWSLMQRRRERLAKAKPDSIPTNQPTLQQTGGALPGRAFVSAP